jgi:hypothetical protein
MRVPYQQPVDHPLRRVGETGADANRQRSPIAHAGVHCFGMRPGVVSIGRGRLPAVDDRRPSQLSRRTSAPQRLSRTGVRGLPWLALSREAVAQTPGEAAGSFLRVGFEIGHRIRHESRVRPEVVRPSRSGGHLRDRAAAFPRWLYATASTTSRSTGRACCSSTAARTTRQPIPCPRTLPLPPRRACATPERAGPLPRARRQRLAVSDSVSQSEKPDHGLLRALYARSREG